jgi:hypothetical protein
MPVPVPSRWADKANDNDSVGVNDVTLVAGSRPRKAHNGPGRVPIRGPRTMTQSPAPISRATMPPGKHVARPGEAFAIKEVANGHVTGPRARTRSPVQNAKAATSPGKHVANPGEASAVKEAAKTTTTSAMAWPHSVNKWQCQEQRPSASLQQWRMLTPRTTEPMPTAPLLQHSATNPRPSQLHWRRKPWPKHT